MDALFLVLIAIVLGAAGQILMKQGMNQIKGIDLSDFLKPDVVAAVFTNLFVLSGIVVYAFSTILWLTALSRLDVSLMYPLVSLSYIIVSVYAFMFLGETITLTRWGGTALVVVGSVLIVLTR